MWEELLSLLDELVLQGMLEYTLKGGCEEEETRKCYCRIFSGNLVYDPYCFECTLCNFEVFEKNMD